MLAEAVRGVEWVLAVWLIGVAVLLRGGLAAARRFRTPSLAAVARDEAGLSYALAYVLTVPFYLFFLCMVYGASMLMVAKLGTLYAAHACARSAVVWQTAKPAELRQERMSQSVYSAMAPFVGARARDVLTARSAPPPSAQRQALEFVMAHEFYSAGSRNLPPPGNRPYPRENAPGGYLYRKYMNAAARTTFRVDDGTRTPGAPLRATITYRAPIYFPGVNRFLSSTGGWPYELEIRSTATLPNETPKSEDSTLGIDYRSR
jgi:hypothetical protein